MDIIDPYCTQLASMTTIIVTEIMVVYTMLLQAFCSSTITGGGGLKHTQLYTQNT